MLPDLACLYVKKAMTAAATAANALTVPITPLLSSSSKKRNIMVNILLHEISRIIKKVLSLGGW